MQQTIGYPKDFVDFARAPYNGELSLETLQSFIDKDALPMPSPECREGYNGDDHWGYWTFGLYDYLNIRKYALHDRTQDNLKILDIGGATGRVMRHFVANHPQADVWIAEINPSHVAWLKNFASNIHAVQSVAGNPLPFDDSTFDLVTGFSVFTHVDYEPEKLLLDIRRLLKPGGKAYLTFHSERTWNNHRGTLLQYLMEQYPGYTEEGGKPLKAERVYYRRADDPYACMVFQTCDFTRRTWGALFDRIEIIDGGHGSHDVAILTKANCEQSATKAPILRLFP